MRQFLFFAADVTNLQASPDGRYLIISYIQNGNRENLKKNVTEVYDLKQRFFLQHRDYPEWIVKFLDENSHIDLRYLNALVDMYKNRDLLNMDTRKFGGESIREKFDFVDEKELYFIYDYDSGFEHGLWGAIRESSLLMCDAPGHQYHCIPDIENLQKMRSVWHDAVLLMNKTIKITITRITIYTTTITTFIIRTTNLTFWIT